MEVENDEYGSGQLDVGMILEVRSSSKISGDVAAFELVSFVAALAYAGEDGTYGIFTEMSVNIWTEQVLRVVYSRQLNTVCVQYYVEIP